MDEADELAWLRYYYKHVDTALGPASDDINHSIASDWMKETGKSLGEPYIHRSRRGKRLMFGVMLVIMIDANIQKGVLSITRFDSMTQCEDARTALARTFPRGDGWNWPNYYVLDNYNMRCVPYPQADRPQ